MTVDAFEALSGTLRSKCMHKLKISAEKPNAIADGELDENDTEGKCYIRCVLKSLNIVSNILNLHFFP